MAVRSRREKRSAQFQAETDRMESAADENLRLPQGGKSQRFHASKRMVFVVFANPPILHDPERHAVRGGVSLKLTSHRFVHAVDDEGRCSPRRNGLCISRL